MARGVPIASRGALPTPCDTDRSMRRRPLARAANPPERVLAHGGPLRVATRARGAGWPAPEPDVVDTLSRRLAAHHPGNDQWPDLYVPR